MAENIRILIKNTSEGDVPRTTVWYVFEHRDGLYGDYISFNKSRDDVSDEEIMSAINLLLPQAFRLMKELREEECADG